MKFQTEIHNEVMAVLPESRNGWRQWLKKNHHSERSVWLILYKPDTSRFNLVYHEAVEEALCFGWVDSKSHKRDAESSYLYFARRNPKSNWSRSNRQRVEKLIAAGKMEEAGLKMVEEAKQRGTWMALESVQSLEIPDDLQNALNMNPMAFKHFNAFPPSSKRIILEWLLNAKKAETRQARIQKTVEMAEINQRANHFHNK